jgi:hypothetical protein
MAKRRRGKPAGDLGRVMSSFGGRTMKLTLIGGAVLAVIGLAGILYDVVVTRNAGPAGVVGGLLLLAAVA